MANLAKVGETGSTWEFHIPRIDTWGYLALRSGVNEDGENLVYPMNGAFTVKYLVDLDDKDRRLQVQGHEGMPCQPDLLQQASPSSKE